MTPHNWIVCERTSRWVAALRRAWDVEWPNDPSAPRFIETRNLADAADALKASPTSIVAVEVRPQNLAEVLAWLARASDCFHQARLVALLDPSFNVSPQDAERDPLQLEPVLLALREAGAVQVTRSPRNLRTVLELAQRHFQSHVSLGVVAESSPIQRVWESLPWQAG